MPSQRRTPRAPDAAAGPTFPPITTAWEAAQQAAEAVRALNHLTLTPGGYAEPADVDAVVLELTQLAWRLPQALAQAGRWLTREHDARRIRHDTYPAQVGAAVDSVLSQLIQATAAAELLAARLDLAREQTAHLDAAFPEHPSGGAR